MPAIAGAEATKLIKSVAGCKDIPVMLARRPRLCYFFEILYIVGHTPANPIHRSMKKIQCLLFLCFNLLIAKGQITFSDSGRISSAPMDSGRIKDLNGAARKFLFSNTDSSIQYAQEALFFAHKMQNFKLEAEAYYLLGGNYWITGDYAKALLDILKSLQINESLHEQAAIADDYRALASIYRDRGDSSNAILYADRCKAIAGKDIFVDIYTIIGSIYQKFGPPDSALWYLRRADTADIKDHGRSNYGYISLVFGNVYYRQSNYPLAVAYYRKAIRLMEDQKVYKDLMEGDIGLARVFREMSQTDSAIIYSRKALEIGSSTPFLLSMLDAGGLLFQLYRGKKDFDSSLKYADLSLSIRDTLYSLQKAREFQGLVFREQMREQEIEQARLQSEEDRSQNVQIAGIGAFIPMFFVIVLILSRRRLNHRIVDFLVLIGLLLFFEFITLLIHPRLESWTHHKPILMLLSLAAIAGILVPSHHRLESWLKKHMAFSHRK
jgi:tetratricopeptide (TPR) repeat protein